MCASFCLYLFRTHSMLAFVSFSDGVVFLFSFCKHHNVEWYCWRQSYNRIYVSRVLNFQFSHIKQQRSEHNIFSLRMCIWFVFVCKWFFEASSVFGVLKQAFNLTEINKKRTAIKSLWISVWLWTCNELLRSFALYDFENNHLFL